MAEQVYNRLKESNIGDDLYSYLYYRNSLPKVNFAHYLGDGVSGKYTGDGNIVDLLHRYNNATINHEFAHAADNALESQYYQRPTSWNRPDVPTYFTDAYDKLRGATANSNYLQQRVEMAKKMAPEWAKANDKYRASNKELVGWGAGRQQDTGDPEYKVPNHLDSTMATELSILMDLARRKDIPFPKQPSWFDRLFSR